MTMQRAVCTKHTYAHYYGCAGATVHAYKALQSDTNCKRCVHHVGRARLQPPQVLQHMQAAVHAGSMVA
jgi:hypothetical protein